MSHKKLRPFIVKVSVLGYFPLYVYIQLIRIRNYNGSVSESLSMNTFIT